MKSKSNFRSDPPVFVHVHVHVHVHIDVHVYLYFHAHTQVHLLGHREHELVLDEYEHVPVHVYVLRFRLIGLNSRYKKYIYGG
jgi:hypothetical protein